MLVSMANAALARKPDSLSISAGSLDRYIEGSSAVHEADPRLKTGLTFAFIVALTLLPVAEWWFIAGFGIAAWLLVRP